MQQQLQKLLHLAFTPTPSQFCRARCHQPISIHHATHLVTSLKPTCAAATAAGTPGFSSPGCTKFSDTFVYTNPDYTTVRELLSLPQVGLTNVLSNLTSPATLFAPNNEAFALYDTAANITDAEGLTSPFLTAGAQLLVVPEAILVRSLQHPATRASHCDRPILHMLHQCDGHAWSNMLKQN